MTELFPPQTVLTPTSATNDLQSFGLEALGLTAPALSPVWSDATPTQYSMNDLTLELQNPRAAFRGMASWEPEPVTLSAASGAPLTGAALVLRLHPEAARRLQIQSDLRLGSNVHPTPVAVAYRGLPAPNPAVPQLYLANETLGTGVATVTFHDNRGLAIDPVAMAALWNDLLGWRQALNGATTIPGAMTDAGGVGTIATKFGAGVVVHVVDPHGWRYAPPRTTSALHVVDGNGVEAAALTENSVAQLAANQTVGRTAAEQATDNASQWVPLRWGFARNGVLANTALAAPALPNPGTLAARFLRVMAVDLDWHLLGNRTNADSADAVAGAVTRDDATTPAFLVPRVRDPVPGFAWLPTGSDVLGAMAGLTQGFGTPGDQLMAIAAAPSIDPAVTAPPAPGLSWPAFPTPPAGSAELTNTADPRAGIRANWRNPADNPMARNDVVVTIAASQVPLGAHVRAYPRSFVEIQSIGPQPSFVRGDGGAALAQGGDLTLLLRNPFGLAAAEPHPSTPLTIDLVIVSRTGRRRVYSAVSVPVDPTPVSPLDPGFAGTSILAPGTLIAAILDGLRTRAIAPVPLFGLLRPPAAALPPDASLTDLLRRLATDDQPRQGPRLPTQARFDSVFVTATMTPPATTYQWQAVTSGIRFSDESRIARPELANPGNPAGPDAYASGVACQGWLARDIAVHALRRAQPIFIPDSPTTFHGWIATLMDAKWNDPPADTTGTVAAAALETIAANCDTPELATAPQPAPGATLQNLVDRVAAAISVPSPTVSLGAVETRVVPLVQREIATARSGQRDALWSLNRALSQARELIYLESPGFNRTARPTPAPKPHQIDLVDVIAKTMTANPRLKVILCSPREGDFDRSRPAWTVTALADRATAVRDLISVDPARIAAFHPFGFPGRAPAIRTTTVIVDDVYCLSGTSHFRRRGMTFDGALDIAHIDRQLTDGYSTGIAGFRRRLIAEKLGIATAVSPATASSDWVRLATPEGTFGVIRELLASGGSGRLQPMWAGPKADGIIAKPDEQVDPDGVETDAFLDLFLSMLLED